MTLKELYEGEDVGFGTFETSFYVYKVCKRNLTADTVLPVIQFLAPQF